jgi:hypothetical protein
MMNQIHCPNPIGTSTMSVGFFVGLSILFYCLAVVLRVRSSVAMAVIFVFFLRRMSLAMGGD